MNSTKILDYLDSMNERVAKVNTIDSLSLFSTIVNSFPLETPGTEEAAQRINEMFFPQQPDQEDCMVYLFSHKDFVCIKQSLEILTDIFKELNASESLEVVKSTESKINLSASNSSDEDRDKMSEGFVATLGDNDENEDISNTMTEEADFSDTQDEWLPPDDESMEYQDVDEDNKQEIPKIVTPTVKSIEGPSTESQDCRQNLKELIVWICEEASKKHFVPTALDPLRGHRPSFYGLSSRHGKSSFCFSSF